MDSEQIKIAIPLAMPFIKEVVERYISPKVRKLIDKKSVSIKMTAHSFENQFEAYLKKSYNKYSFINVLVLGNQQKKLKELYIPLEVIRENDRDIKYIINDFSDDFIPVYKKVLITDTAGMGKSTISKRLFLAAVEQQVGVPILIELRRLGKDKRIIDEIFRQLSLINERVNEDFVLELIHLGGFVFMFDGFDEIEKEERKFVIEDITNFIDKAGENFFVLTSRKEDALNSFGDFMSFKIRPLFPEEAQNLLRKYDSNGETSSLLINKLSEKENESVKDFLHNPLLVSLLFAAFEAKHTIPLKKHMFYRQVYDAFFEKHDLTKGDSYIRNKYTGLESDDFHRVLRYIGYNCTRATKIEFSKDEIITLIENAKDFCVGLSFKANDFLKDILTKVPLFVEDGLYFKWAHKSIQEYFSACFIYTDSKVKQGDILVALAKNQEYKHYNLLDIYYSIDYKTYRRYVIYDLLKSYFVFLDELKNIWPDITDALVLKLFSEAHIFIKYKPNANRENMFNEAINKVRKFYPVGNGVGTYTKFLEEPIRHDFVKVLSLPNVYSNTLDFLSNKAAEFIEDKSEKYFNNYDENENEDDRDKDFVEGSLYDLRHLNMEEDVPYLLHGADSSDIFKGYDVNNFINVFVFPSMHIDSEKARVVFNSIEVEIAQEKSIDFLMSGL